MKKQFRDFESAREFVRSLGLKNQKEWREYCKSGNKPENIPSVHPERTYKKEWKGMGDWLGTGTIATYNIHYRSFKEARKFVRALKISGQRQWQEEYVKSGNKPVDIPSNPQRVYKNEWQGWGDWTGTGNIAPSNLQYRSFAEAREFVRSLGIKNRHEWNEYCKSGNKPDDIPATPWNTYKEWNKK